MNKTNLNLLDTNVVEPNLRTFIYLLQTADVINKYADRVYYKKGMSQIKYVALHVMAINGGTMRPSDLARWTFRERHDMTTLIRRLEKQGLVRLQRSTIDKREVNVILTDKGWQLLKEMESLADEIVKKVLASISGKKAEALEKLLQILRQNTEQRLEEINKTR